MTIHREPVSVEELHLDICPSVSQATLIKALNSLVQRSLIEKQANQFSLQPVLMEYATNLRVEQVCQEVETGELTLLNSHTLFKAEYKDSLVHFGSDHQDSIW